MTSRNPLVFVPGGTPVIQELPAGDTIAGSTVGATGPTGAQGSTGSQGPQGAQGNAGTSGITQIAQVITSGSQATVVFSSIPGSYTNLRLTLIGRDTKATVDDTNFSIFFNADQTAANYSSIQQTGNKAGSPLDNTIAATTNGMAIGLMPGTLSVATAIGSLNVTIHLYANTSWHKIVEGTSFERYGSSATTIASVVRAGVWLSTAAITSLTLTAGGTAFTNGSVVTLYGMQ